MATQLHWWAFSKASAQPDSATCRRAGVECHFGRSRSKSGGGT
eukprot:CAMPEP_0171113762 /NCGR_PEP_ID=MMETSP0766_2-20121228/83500_1 /TAXON_ID=439317 /ORGANISM="Gambierdiscus australes, Strain CAWD 149" /LENGTH=42 /DNA_ID= /DNA_START= /DNA_END= /DNA_ORIENTATION=